MGACVPCTLSSRNRASGLKLSELLTSKMNTYKCSAHGYSLHASFSMEEIELPVKFLQTNERHVAAIANRSAKSSLQKDCLQITESLWLEKSSKVIFLPPILPPNHIPRCHTSYFHDPPPPVQSVLMYHCSFREETLPHIQPDPPSPPAQLEATTPSRPIAPCPISELLLSLARGFQSAL